MLIFSGPEGQPLLRRSAQEKYAIASATGRLLQIERYGLDEFSRPLLWPRFKKDTACKMKP